MYLLTPQEINLIKNKLINTEIIQYCVSNVGPFIINFLNGVSISINYKFLLLDGKKVINSGQPQPKEVNSLYNIAGHKIENVENENNNIILFFQHSLSLVVIDEGSEFYESFIVYENRDPIVIV